METLDKKDSSQKMGQKMNDVDWSKWDSTEDCFAKYAHVKSKLIYGKLPAEKPDISVMIPTFRRADLLKEAIDSALKQKTRYHYIIAVIDNDAEGDEATDKLLKAYCEKHANILYYRNKQNIGMFGNWNRCIELSQTEWLCMLHDDDMLMENYLETLYPIARSNRYGIVGSYKKILDQRKNADAPMSETGRSSVLSAAMKLFIWARRGKEIPMTLQDGGHCMFHPAVANLINRNSAIKLGGFDDTFFPNADMFFFEKMTKYYGVSFVPDPLYYYRFAQNESIKEGYVWYCLRSSSALVKAIQETRGLSECQCERSYIEGVVIAYNICPDAKKKICAEDVASKFQIPKKYFGRGMQSLIMLKYNCRWGMLLFRKRKRSK